VRQSATSGAGKKIGRRHEILGIVCVSLAMLVALSLWSYDTRGGENWIGPLGQSLASVLGRAFGWTAWLVPVELTIAALHCMRLIRPSSAIGHACSAFSQLVLGCAFLHLALHSVPAFGGQPSGGVLGELLGEVLKSLVGNVGAFVVCFAALTIALILRTSFSIVATTRGVLGFSAAHSKGLMEMLSEGAKSLWDAWLAAQALEREERGRAPRSSQRRSKPRAKPAASNGPPPLPSPAEAAALRADNTSGKVAAEGGKSRTTSSSGALAAPKQEEELEEEEEELEEEEGEEEEDEAEEIEVAPVRGRKKKNDREPVIIAPMAESRAKRPAGPIAPPPRNSGTFVLPPTALLTEVPPERIVYN
jgi:hypothetical protein